MSKSNITFPSLVFKESIFMMSYAWWMKDNVNAGGEKIEEKKEIQVSEDVDKCAWCSKKIEGEHKVKFVHNDVIVEYTCEECKDEYKNSRGLI